MACVHCGLCLGSCPTYLETGNENDSPRGRIHLMRAVQDGRMELADEPIRHLDTCLGCRACETACPSGVAYGELLEHTRHFIEGRHTRSWPERWLRDVLIERVFPYPERMDLALRPAQWLRAAGMEKWLPERARTMVELLPKQSSWRTLPAFSPAEGEVKGTLGMLSGCVMQVLFGDTHQHTIRLLNRSGWNVVVPPAQSCCGALHSHAGKLELARDSARRNIEVFEQARVDAVVVNAAGCGSAMKGYASLFEERDEWCERARRFASKVRDLSEVLDFTRFVAGPWRRGKVTFHDACHLAHAQGITRQPRQWVRKVAGEHYVELPEAEVCCGSAGSYNLTELEMAARLQRRKVEKIGATGALTVVTSNPGCQMQIEAGLRNMGYPQVRVMHLADFLAEAVLAADL